MLKKKQRLIKKNHTWCDKIQGRVWERELIGLLDLEVRCGVYHARVGDWERDVARLLDLLMKIEGLPVDNKSQENWDEDWLTWFY